MRIIRILIIDDSVVGRRLVSDVLGADAALEVAGTAASGRIALAKIPQLDPDIVTLDVEMPDMDGLQTLAVIRRDYPRLPVIIFSSLTDRGAAATLDALSLGATDCVAKPTDVGSVAAAGQYIREQLVPKIKLFAEAAANGSSPSLRGLSTLRPPSMPQGLCLAGERPPRAVLAPGPRVEVVAIGVSTGGPNALAEILPTWPADFPVPVVIVQHMPPVFTRLLAERLASRSALRVAEGVSGGRLEPSHVWLAPGGYHMAVVRDALGGKLHVHDGPPENSCRPAVDVLFRSVAAAYGSRTLAVVLTGMGQDGLRGCEAVHEAGGQILVQDKASSVVWGMPGFVARAGLAERVVPLGELGAEILGRVRQGRYVGIKPAQPEWR
jgi:two-component system chemotaxis response regulator CheB